MGKPSKSASSTIPLALAITSDLRGDLLLLAASRKLRASTKPRSITQIVDAAIFDLAARIERGANIGFVTVPRVPVRASVRASLHAHGVAVHTSRNADVRVSDFVRTAISRYLRKHGHEILRLAKRR